MQREIKFRAWSEDCKCMILPDNKAGVAMNLKGNVYIGGIRVTDIILMQYTGLKDQANRDIYEGDIVRFSGFQQFEVYQHPSGDWQAGGLSIWEHMGEYDEINEWEVLSNIYETPEFLKGGIAE